MNMPKAYFTRPKDEFHRAVISPAARISLLLPRREVGGDVPYDYPKRRNEIRLTPYDMFTHVNAIYDRFRSCDMICIPCVPLDTS
ncbi:MAG: hypothetical protein IKZ44_08315, partial [Clostridia bacterium]|nr:hypothetical protein [Clostridia bacterium]